MAYLLLLNGGPTPPGMADLTGWLSLSDDVRFRTIRLFAQVGLGNTVYPGDYRSAGQVAAASSGDPTT